MTFEKSNWYIILFTTENNVNNMEHMVGFSEPPTIIDTQSVLNDAIESGSVPHETKPVYMCQMTADNAHAVFSGLK